MSELEAQAPEPQAAPEPAAEPAAQAAPVAEPVAPADPEAEFDAAVEASAIDVPDGDRLVPLSAVTRLREKLREAKAGSTEAADLRTRLEQAEGALREVTPLAQAFRAMQQAPQQQVVQQPTIQQLPAEDTTELEDVAKLFDFYTPDGKPDIDKARKFNALADKRAEKKSQDAIRPYAEQSIQERADYNIRRAMNTRVPSKDDPNEVLEADPTVLKHLTDQIRQNPGGLETLANPEAVKQLWLNAVGQTQAMRSLGLLPKPQKAAPVQQQQQTTAPVVTERSGGQVTAQPKGLSAAEKKAAKEAGLSEKAYLEVASKMPW